MIVVSIRAHQYKDYCDRIYDEWYTIVVMYIDGDMIVVSIRAHQCKLALRRQVLRTGGAKNLAQQYKLALRQRVINIQNNKC